MTEPRGTFGHWIGIAMLAGSAVMLVRAGIVRDPGLQVPPYIAYVAAGIFLVGAYLVLQQVRGIRTHTDAAAAVILAGFTAIGGWIALAPDSGGCTVSSGGASAEVSGLGCRIPFGLLALVSGIMTVHVVRRWLRRRKSHY